MTTPKIRMSEARLWGWKRITLLIILVLLSLFIISAGISYYFLNHVDTAKARLIVGEGNVTVNGGEVTGIMELQQGDIIETKEDGLSTVLIYDSVIVNLEQNTKIRLKHLNKDHPLVEQFYGNTWNTLTGLFGVKNYTITYGTLLVFAQGTVFTLGGKDYAPQLYVAKGQVQLETREQNYTVVENQVAEKKSGQMVQREANSYEKQVHRWQRETGIMVLEQVRVDEIYSHEILLKIIKQKYRVTDEEITEGIRAVDEGKYTVDELVRRLPIPLNSVTKLAELTKTIQQFKQEIREAERLAEEQKVLVEKVQEEDGVVDKTFIVSNESVALRNKFVMKKPEMVRIDKE